MGMIGNSCPVCGQDGVAVVQTTVRNLIHKELLSELKPAIASYAPSQMAE
jgi:hypothetical protein